jgi:hypothetical protein
MQESGPPQTMTALGKSTTGGVGGRSNEKQKVDKGCCGGCVIL